MSANRKAPPPRLRYGGLTRAHWSAAGSPEKCVANIVKTLAHAFKHSPDGERLRWDEAKLGFDESEIADR